MSGCRRTSSARHHRRAIESVSTYAFDSEDVAVDDAPPADLGVEAEAIGADACVDDLAVGCEEHDDETARVVDAAPAERGEASEDLPDATGGVDDNARDLTATAEALDGSEREFGVGRRDDTNAADAGVCDEVSTRCPLRLVVLLQSSRSVSEEAGGDAV